MPAAPPALPVVVIVQPPPALAVLAPGTVLEAIVLPENPKVVAPAADGTKPNVTLRTAVGDVTVRLPVQLPDNARVALEVLRTAVQATPAAMQQVTARVITIDGQPAAQVLAQLARQAVDARAPAQVPQQLLAQVETQSPLLRVAVLLPGAAWTPTGPLQVTALNTFSGFILQGTPPQPVPGPNGTTPQAAVSAPVATAAATPTLQMPTGSEISVRVTAVQLPEIAAPVQTVPNTLALVPAPGAQNAAPSAIAVPLPASAAPSAPVVDVPVTLAPTAPAPVTPTPQPGLILAAPPGLAAAPPVPPLTVQSAPVLATITGIVTGTSPSGAPEIETAIGLTQVQLQLNVRANLPVGTRVTLEIAGLAEPLPNAVPPQPPASLPLTGPAGAMVGWPTLTEALTVMQRGDPQAAQQLAQAIPDGGPRTALALMSFAQAMRAGDARQWPGDSNLRALERLGPRGSHLASQLSDEVAALSSRAREGGAEWRALPVPWNADGHIDRIALITRREGEGDDDAKKKAGGGGTRFLINLDLTRLGSMQLDGMFRREAKGFDLMIRTKAALPETIRLDLTGLFAASHAAMGLKGGLTFQVVKKFADPLAQGPLGADKSGLWA